jgi:hypothetical protein
MRFRTRHLAFLLLLFASLSPAEGHAMSPANLPAGARYVSMLFSQRAATAISVPEEQTASYKIQTLALPAAARTQHRIAWAVRPPSAQSISQHAVTGSSL